MVEGPTLAREAVAAGWTCHAQFVSPGPVGAIDGAGPVIELDQGVLERVGSTEAPQAPLVVVEIPDNPVDLADASCVLVLDRIQDPGNLGTILRSAEASGIDAVVVTPGSVDLYNPKTVRASAGALFHIPAMVASIQDLRHAGQHRLIGTSSHEGVDRSVVAYTDADLTGPLALVLGNEAAGLPVEWTDDDGPIDGWITIEHRGRSESLNVAMAATVLAFEVARQRTAG